MVQTVVSRRVSTPLFGVFQILFFVVLSWHSSTSAGREFHGAEQHHCVLLSPPRLTLFEFGVPRPFGGHVV